MNPLKIWTYEPLERKNLTLPAKILVFFIEWIARFIGAVYLSVALIIIGIIPFRGASKTFFRTLGTVTDTYRMKYMAEEYGLESKIDEGVNKSGRKKMDKGYAREVPSLETTEQLLRDNISTRSSKVDSGSNTRN